MRALALFLLAALSVSVARAEEAAGSVRAVYYETARGVLVDGSMLRPAGATRWVDVELEDKRRVLVQVPSHLRAGVGDVVGVQLGEPKSVALAGVTVVNRVTAVREQSQIARNPIRVP